MKVFDAKDGQVILVGDSITIRIYRNRKGLKIGVEAPDQWHIRREKALQKENKSIKSTASTT